MNLMPNKLFLFFSPFVYLVTLVFPKNKNLWVFGSWFGMRYSDNTRYVYEYIMETNADIDCIWISKDLKIVEDLNARGLKSLYAYSFKGIFAQLRAHVFLMTVNSNDFYFATLSPRNVQLQLWHGTPLKKISLDSLSLLGRIKYKLRAFFVDRYTSVISPFKEVDGIIESAFGVSECKLIRSLNPRSDGMFISESEKGEVISKLMFDKNYCNLIYLPTHRNEGNSPELINAFVCDLIKISEDLRGLNVRIYVKPHFYEKDNIDVSNFTNNIIYLKDDADIDLYKMLAVCDGLITDYSSVVFEYPLLNNPMIFYMPDIDTYRINDRDVYFMPEEVSDKFCQDSESLLNEIKKIINNSYKSSLKLDVGCLPEGESITAKYVKIISESVY